MSWAGKILRVDLTAGTVKSEPLNMTWAREYLGSRGLASKYLVEEMDPKIDPLSPANKLIWATGPLTGTMASTGGRYTVVTKGPLTGAIACSNSGGYWGAELKMAGWDMVIFEGASPKPVYLLIQDDAAELEDASHLWGKTVWETEAALKKGHQDPLLRVSCIGGAGENKVLFAAVVNDLHRAAGRSGVGAVMGSKNLKADRGARHQGRGQHRRPQGVHEGHRREEEDPGRQRRHRPGPAGLWHSGADERHQRDRRAAHAQPPRRASSRAPRTSRPRRWPRRARPTARSSWSPTRPASAARSPAAASARWTRATSRSRTSRSTGVPAGGLEYEAAWALGAANGVNDLEALQYANLLCNEHGMDPISFGATIGAVMELYEMGVLTKEQLGIDASFGSAQALAHFAEITAKGEGFGKEIGQGSKRLTAKYGHPELSMTRQGPGIPGLRQPRHPGHGPGLRHQQPRRLPPARLHGGLARCWASRSRPIR